MSASKFIGYIASRIGIMLALTIFGAFAGMILFPAIVTFFPSSMSGFKTFMTSTTTDSVIAFIIMLAFFLRIFYDDGKRHAAYESWSSVNITIVYLLMLMVYFIPAIFRESFSAEGKGEVFYKVFYYPCQWLIGGFGMDYMVGVLVGIGLLLVASFGIYLTAYKIYIHKHPVILKAPKRFEEQEQQ